MADVAQHGKELPLALHHFGLAGHARCGERPHRQRVVFLGVGAGEAVAA